MLVFSNDFWIFSIYFCVAFSFASCTLSAFFLSSSRRRKRAFALSCSSSMPCKSTISTPNSPTASLDFLSSVSKGGVKLGPKSRYQPPPVRCEVDQVHCWFVENMHVELNLSSHANRNMGRFSFVIALFARSLYLKYLRVRHNSSLYTLQSK